MKHKKIMIKMLSLLLVVVLFYAYLNYFTDFSQKNDENKFHIHANLKVFINGEAIDFSQNKYQTEKNKTFSSDVHLHDGIGDIIHYHSKGITLGKFFKTLNIEFNVSCIIIESEKYCVTDSTKLQTYVNGIQIVNPQFYVAKDLDQILIAYGNIDDDFTTLLATVNDTACIQSEKCPQRGPPSDESSCAGEVCAFDIS